MMSNLQKRKMTRYFNCLDTDANGYLEEDDFERVAERLCAIRGYQPGSTEADAVTESVMTIWNNAREMGDADDDGRLSLEEWIAHEQAVFDSPEHIENYMQAVTRDVFDLVDADGSGDISPKEYAQLLHAFGMEEEIAEVAFKRLDLNGDGSLSRDEFVTLVTDFHLSDKIDNPGNWLFGPF